MRKFLIHFLLFLFCIIIKPHICKSQNPYIGSTQYDLNWVLQTSLSDDFSGQTIDASKWCVLNNCTGSPPCACWNWGGNSRFSSSNVSVGNGILSLKVNGPIPGSTPPYDFWECCNTGGIQSNNESYTYGYLEINAKLPGFFDGNGIVHGDKFWPAFWAFHQEFDTNNLCIIVHDEIDILEPSGSQYADAKTNVSGVWNETNNLNICPWQPTPPCTYCTYKVESSITSTDPLCSSFHKFAVEWNTDRMVYYFDDNQFFISHDIGNIMDSLRIVIDQQIDENVDDFYSGQPFPDTMKVDYFHFYKLRLDCSSSLTIFNNTDLANYYTPNIPAVKSDITFGNGAGTIALSSGVYYIFRAVNTMSINGEFTIPSGSEFTLMPTPCN